MRENKHDEAALTRCEAKREFIEGPAASGSDVFSPEKRSAVMSRIRSNGNRDTELRMVALFRAHRITGWRRRRKLFGKPDFAFDGQRLAVFVDGCFWHGCPKPKHAPRPKNNALWWAEKLDKNKARDRRVTRTLQTQGWRVLRVWECDLAKPLWSRVARRVKRLLTFGSKSGSGRQASDKGSFLGDEWV